MQIVKWQELILFIASTFFLDFTNLEFYKPKNINKVVEWKRKYPELDKEVMADVV